MYSYCYNNPLGFTDPTGHWGLSNIKKWCGNRAKDVGKAATAAAKVVVNNIDYVQAAIDVAGLIPVVGEAFDAVNAGIYAARGDYVSAGLSLAACIPIAGTAATAAKLAKTAVKAVDKAQSLKKVTKAVNTGQTTLKNSLRAATHGHHPFPTFLGGPKKRVLTQMSSTSHVQPHNDLVVVPICVIPKRA